MSWVASLRSRAAAARKRVLFPESGDARTLDAVRALAREGIVVPALLLDPRHGADHAAARATGVETLDPAAHADRDAVAAALAARRASHGLTRVEAAELARRPLWFADGLVALGRADACVAGAATTTADVLRAALWAVGPAPGIRTVSSCFYMVTRTAGVLTFADCGVVQYPTAEQLAEIAVAAARDRRLVVGDEPVVAFLSHSTKGSAEGDSVDKVRRAVELFRALEPGVPADGDLQGDAALVPLIARRKAPGSPAAGRANVLVFPDLDSGNIAYKLVQRIAQVPALGPVVQGLARPCSDLSRGATADDIVLVSAIALLQSRAASQGG